MYSRKIRFVRSEMTAGRGLGEKLSMTEERRSPRHRKGRFSGRVRRSPTPPRTAAVMEVARQSEPAPSKGKQSV